VKDTLKIYWFGFWIRVAYLLGLRRLSCWAGRWLAGDNKVKKTELPKFDDLEHVESYFDDLFQYRYDKILIEVKKGATIFLPLDWVSDPRVFQTKLEDAKVKDGDCDDAHFWFAHAIQGMAGVEEVYLLSSGWPGGAHATTVFRFFGQWLHFDYRIYELEDPMDAPAKVAERYTKGGAKSQRVTFWNFERVTPTSWEPAAICPKEIER
jgi:hypothetical protein